jgi:hypothetical protein
VPRRLAVRSADGAAFVVVGEEKSGTDEGWYLPRPSVAIAVAGEANPRVVEIGDADLEITLP